jgi:stress-induced morphogen
MSLPGPIYRSIQAKLSTLSPTLLEITNESWKHSSHQAMKGVTSTETHFKIQIVSSVFESKVHVTYQ